jgi:DNA-binding GntR family transcriptional regulator
MPLQIADALAHDIIEERYAPGARLNENQNAAQWGVSRSPLREALRILEKRGLVVITPQRGARVTALSIEEVEQLFEIRAVLVGLAAKGNAALNEVLRRPAVVDRLSRSGISAVADSTPASTAQMISSEIVKWRTAFKLSGVQPE